MGAAFQTHDGLQQQLNEPWGYKSARQAKMTATRPFFGLRLPDFLCIISGALERGARYHGTFAARDAAQVLAVSPTQWRESTRRLLSSSRRRNNAADRWRQLRT